MSRQIIGSLEYPAGTNFTGNIEARHIEGSAVVIPQSISEFPVTNAAYDFTLENGAYQFSIVGILEEGATEESKIKIGLGVINDGTPVDLLTLIGLSEPLSSPIEDLINERGLPTGGTTGQHLAKVSGTDGDTTWVDAIEEAPVDGQDYVRRDADWVVSTGGGGGGGASSFTDLTDTPTDYTGSANRSVKVNSGGTGLEFSALTKSDVGLGQVDNTSDANKPVSTATQTALGNKVDQVAGKGLSTEDYTTAEQTKLLGIATGAQVNTVDSVAGKTGVVSLVKADVGLGQVDDTSDANKPVSTAQQTALDGKEDDLNLPASDGQILSSTTGGVRSWIDPSSGGGFTPNPTLNIFMDALVDTTPIASSGITVRGNGDVVKSDAGNNNSAYILSKYLTPIETYFEVGGLSTAQVELEVAPVLTSAVWSSGFKIRVNQGDGRVVIFETTSATDDRPRGRSWAHRANTSIFLTPSETLRVSTTVSSDTVSITVSDGTTSETHDVTVTGASESDGFIFSTFILPTTNAAYNLSYNFGNKDFVGTPPSTATPLGSSGLAVYLDAITIWSGDASSVSFDLADFPAVSNFGEYRLKAVTDASFGERDVPILINSKRGTRSLAEMVTGGGTTFAIGVARYAYLSDTSAFFSVNRLDIDLAANSVVQANRNITEIQFIFR